MNDITLNTYSVSSQVNGLNIPLPMQSSFMRAYSEASGFLFRLPVVEVFNSVNAFMLIKLLSSVSIGSHVCSSTVILFPLNNPHVVKEVIRLSELSHLTWHFHLEGKVIQYKYFKEYMNQLCTYMPVDYGL